MKVVDYQQAAWFLFEYEGELYLDANYSHSAFSYCYMIKLLPDELVEHKKDGHEYLTKLAYEVHYSAPGVKGSTSKYLGRDVSKEFAEQTSLAVKSWRESGGS